MPPPLGRYLLALASGLIWKAARTLDGKPAPLVITLFGTAAVILASVAPGAPTITASLDLAIGACYAFASAVSLWLGRGERLFARWPIIVFLVMHGALLSFGAFGMYSSIVPLDQAPPVMSLFGLIHFESIVFALGASVFVLLMVNERSEAASRAVASTDPLTGIANRTTFLETAERVVERCRRDGTSIALIMFDLDQFKTINDTFGHAVGDAVIREFCKVVGGALRPSDVFGRLGGEEFAAVLPGSGIEAAAIRANGIRCIFAESCRFVMGQPVDANVSGGVAVSSDATSTVAALLALSDEALYRAKAEGRNRISRADQPKSASRTSKVVRIA